MKNFQVNHRKRKNELGNLGHSRTSQLVALGRFYKSYFRNNFFDGLKQYGRDFGKIKTFMSLKAAKDHQIKEGIIKTGYSLPKAGLEMIIFKTKDQVRGLYYRIWSTVSKYVQSSCFPEKLTDKSGQELYAMMAYGELRRKLKVEPSNHRKILELKFGELVKTQQTCVKFKGQLKPATSRSKL